MTSKITFHGGAGTVTGANFLLETGEKKILVDCGALEREHHTGDVCDTTNALPFPYDPASIDVLIVTHAHADHIGRIPKLVRDGFRGAIISTPATRDLAQIMFADALNIMSLNEGLHHCDPLYSQEDIDATVPLWQVHEYHEHFEVGDTRVEFSDAGHILGSALVKFTRGGRTLMFTGDLGNTPEPLLNATESPVGAHYIVMESVYGDRVHEGREGRKERLRQAIEDTRERKGVLLIPSFSIERTQILLSEINEMVESGALKPLPIYLDAPLANKVTQVFREYSTILNPDVRQHFESGDDPFTFKGLTIVAHTGESRALHTKPDPKVIIAGAGMSVGGRIRAHEKAYLGNENTTVLFVGYQAPGSLGRRLYDGEKKVRIDDEWIRVRAQIDMLTGYSGHADRDQLLDFIEQAGESLEKVFITMGEPKASLFLAQRAKDFLGVNAIVPEKDQVVEIDL
ncbi:MAG: RNA-metabolising metallo-beta-lactamase, metallo-beta-lactamase family protein [Candidatus Kaiserbacteria bacterium]|nr:RNA-metabolising metallo-beta-lactamase, metallo-beta-lactamase family protein [Candidatus Kaiserbacteria bacterium]